MGAMALIQHQTLLILLSWFILVFIFIGMLIAIVIPKTSWGTRGYCLSFIVVIVLWQTLLFVIDAHYSSYRSKILHGKYDSCMDSGIIWNKTNRLAICDVGYEDGADDEQMLVYDSSGEIAKEATQRTPEWNRYFIEVCRQGQKNGYVFCPSGKYQPPEVGDFQVIHVYRNFYIAIFSNPGLL
jgi:hypothetical protein